MIPRKLDQNFYMLCGIDRRLEKFENMFTLPGGVSYNSYFLDDEKTVVLDSIDHAVAEGFMAAVEELLQGRDLDALICQHAEPDHCATIVQLMTQYPKCQLYVSALGYKILQQFYPQINYGEDRLVLLDETTKLDTGHHHFSFIKAANVHWPEVFFSFEETTGTLFSADAFGSFGAPAGYIYADQCDYERDWLAENRRYYSNIVGRQGAAVQTVLQKVQGLEVKRICPVHGLVFRTPESVAYIVEKYDRWSRYAAEDQGTVIVYGSLYNQSADLADTLAAYLADQEAGSIRVYDVSKTNVSVIISDLFRFSHAIFVCNNYNTELYPPMDALLRELMMLNWDRHAYSLVGNMSWGGRGVKIAEEILSKGKNLRKLGEDFTIKSSPKLADRESAQAFAAAIAEDMRAEA